MGNSHSGAALARAPASGGVENPLNSQTNRKHPRDKPRASIDSSAPPQTSVSGPNKQVRGRDRRSSEAPCSDAEEAGNSSSDRQNGSGGGGGAGQRERFTGMAWRGIASASATDNHEVESQGGGRSKAFPSGDGTAGETAAVAARFGSLSSSRVGGSPDHADGSVSASISRASSLHDASPHMRMSTEEAKAFLKTIFSPEPGQLECMASNFLRGEQYASLGEFLTPFLQGELREKWLIDHVMRAVIGRDRWRSSRCNEEVTMSVAPTREQVRQLIQQRNECTDLLREKLLDLSGGLVSRGKQRGQGSLRTLLAAYKSHKLADGGAAEVSEATSPLSTVAGSPAGGSAGAPSPEGGTSAVGPGGQGHGHAGAHGGGGVGSSHHHTTPSKRGGRGEPDSLYVTRLRPTVATSFECYDLIAKRIPTTIISNIGGKYFLGTTPVVWSKISYEESVAGELARKSFFVSLQERVELLRGQPRGTVAHSGASHACARSTSYLADEAICFSGFRHLAGGGGLPPGGGAEPAALDSPTALFVAMRNLGLVLTTACSSLVLYVLFQLADAIQRRRRFREMRRQAKERGLTLEELTGKDPDLNKRYLGEAGDNITDWKRLVMTDEMSLTAMARLLVQRYRSDHKAKLDKLRRAYINIFAYLESATTAEEQANFDPARVLGSVALKLMFLLGGGQRSIEADDRRIPLNARQSTDDLSVSRMLEVPVLDRICWIACMLGMPVMSPRGSLLQKRRERPLTFMESDEIAGVMRELFQAVGALPYGSACPIKFSEWLPLFPLYAVNTEGKRTLMYLYSIQASAARPLPVIVQKDMALLSLANGLHRSEDGGFDRTKIMSYLFQPTMTVGYELRRKRVESGAPAPATTSPQQTPPSPAPCESKPSPPAAASMDGDVLEYSYGQDELSASPGDGGGTGATSPTARAKQQQQQQQKEQAAVEATSSPIKAAAPTGKTPTTGEAVAAAARETSADRHRHRDEDDDTSSNSSVSTLMDPSCNIDVYTCVSPAAQLYLRCANETSVRRHRSTELTPFVETDVFPHTQDLRRRRPDIYSKLRRHIGELLPSEAVVALRWTSAEPMVTFQVGDLLSVMLEYQTSVGRRGSSARYFTNQPRRSIEGNGEDAEVGASAVAGAASARSARRQSVVIDTGGVEPGLKGTRPAGGSANTTEEPSTPTSFSDSGSSYHQVASTKARNYHGVMSEFLGGSDRVSRRVGAQWTVVQLFSIRQPDLSTEVILEVHSPELLLTDPMKIIGIGHERASMSPFSDLGTDNTVCWTNPRLISGFTEASTALAAGQPGRARGRSASLPSTTRIITASGKPTVGAALCRSESDLQQVFFTIGVLLANAITNAVFFSVPVAPLCFWLFKKALTTGDHSFSSFMWLEPCDGNLLSPTLVLNHAYEIMSMSDGEYLVYLSSRGLAQPANLVFPVLRSIADESEGRAGAAAAAAAAASIAHGHGADPELSLRTFPSGSSPSGPPHPRRGQPGARNSRGEAGSHTNGCSISETSSGDRRRAPTMRNYLAAIHQHNRSGTMFSSYSHGGSAGSASGLTGSGPRSGPAIHAPMGASSAEAGGGLCPPLPEDPAEIRKLLHVLPSREEYVVLYLVNDIAWSSAQRNGMGGQAKSLWVAMAKGFMTSPVARSPLMTNCCSRVIREVLCTPVNGKRSSGGE